jgi:UDP-N-acetylglucosamine--N-acetylmuramyl-(pentapeptide) pyrophosphoryl-undecaprenol N-acetylglucosamine transferase
VVLASGGTGGHLFPAQALASELEARNWDVRLFTDARGLSWQDRFTPGTVSEISSSTLTPGGLEAAGADVQAGKRLSPVPEAV